VHGTRYIFKVAISILKLIESDLINLDMSGINEYFQSFKYESQSNNLKTGSASAPLKQNDNMKLLPPIEVIISESNKVKINEAILDALKDKFKEEQSPKRTEKKVVKLSKVKMDIEN
jgi:hypothetical protein